MSSERESQFLAHYELPSFEEIIAATNSDDGVRVELARQLISTVTELASIERQFRAAANAVVEELTATNESIDLGLVPRVSEQGQAQSGPRVNAASGRYQQALLGLERLALVWKAYASAS